MDYRSYLLDFSSLSEEPSSPGKTEDDTVLGTSAQETGMCAMMVDGEISRVVCGIALFLYLLF